MLHIENDEPQVRNAIQLRLGGEPGITLLEIQQKVHEATASAPRFLRVGVLVQIDNGTLVADSLFDLPEYFQALHLENEIDQMCEGFKAARKDFWGKGRMGSFGPARTQRTLAGTGLRGLWPKELALPEPGQQSIRATRAKV